jgi:valyl-tRNA synthetase
MIEDMKSQNLLKSQKPITHPVNVHERCGTEIEYIKSKQWFIKYLDLKNKMLEWGNQLHWFPGHMKNRYDNWVKGLQWDWLISRQRYFGIPFPVWYCSKCSEIILAKEKDLPVDPTNEKPKIKECPKCKSKEFVPEKDVFDTWATSSLTPRLAVELMPKKLQKKLFPMNLRPQAHDIITFWLFNTTFRSNIHYNCNPWQDCMISGWALDPHGKKMSKSKGNVVEPQLLIEKYSADCLRFWAAGSKLGEDLAYMEKDFVTAQKFITKFWNASKFGLMHLQDYKGLQMSQKSQSDFSGHLEDYKQDKPEKLEAFDIWFMSKLNNLIKFSTESFGNYEYSKAKFETEQFFWQTFCDNYMEIIKDRLYNPNIRGIEQRKSAQYVLYNGILACLKLMAPITPHFTEEIYSLYFKEKENRQSIHISDWPKFDKKLINKDIEKSGDNAIAIIAAVRKFKAENKMSMKDEIAEIIVSKDSEKQLKSFVDDLKSTLKIKNIKFSSEADTEIAEGIKIKIIK